MTFQKYNTSVGQLASIVVLEQDALLAKQIAIALQSTVSLEVYITAGKPVVYCFRRKTIDARLEGVISMVAQTSRVANKLETPGCIWLAQGATDLQLSQLVAEVRDQFDVKEARDLVRWIEVRALGQMHTLRNDQIASIAQKGKDIDMLYNGGKYEILFETPEQARLSYLNILEALPRFQ